MAIKQEWTCDSADIILEGCNLGYDWNNICDLMSKERVQRMDGAGSVCVSKTDKFDSPILTHIFKHIFETYGMTSLTIIDEF